MRAVLISSPFRNFVHANENRAAPSGTGGEAPACAAVLRNFNFGLEERDGHVVQAEVPLASV